MYTSQGGSGRCGGWQEGGRERAWTASSRVGVRTSAYVAAMRRFLNRSRSSSGSANAAVLPEPGRPARALLLLRWRQQKLSCTPSLSEHVAVSVGNADVPVMALPQMSLPASAKGMQAACITTPADMVPTGQTPMADVRCTP